MPEISLSFAVNGHFKLQEQLKLLMLTPAKQRKLLRELGNTVIRMAKENVSRQRTVGGAPMQPRKDNRDRRKLLRKMASTLGLFHKGSAYVRVSAKNALTARIGWKHQHGQTDEWTPAKARKAYGQPDYKAAATPAQAKALLEHGFGVPVKKKGKGRELKRVPARWICQNMTLGQAGLVLKHLRQLELGKEMAKDSWQVAIPARPFLGVGPDKEEALLNTVARQMLAGLSLG